jgi:hypothetical protein
MENSLSDYPQDDLKFSRGVKRSKEQEAGDKQTIKNIYK